MEHQNRATTNLKPLPSELSHWGCFGPFPSTVVNAQNENPKFIDLNQTNKSGCSSVKQRRLLNSSLDIPRMTPLIDETTSTTKDDCEINHDSYSLQFSLRIVVAHPPRPWILISTLCLALPILLRFPFPNLPLR